MPAFCGICSPAAEVAVTPEFLDRMASAIAYRSSGCCRQYVNRQRTVGMVWVGFASSSGASSAEGGTGQASVPAADSGGLCNNTPAASHSQENELLTSEDRGVVCVYDGAPANAADLKKVCTSKGHTFAGKHHAEAVVHLFEDFGNAAVTSLRGALSFALWDNARHRLFLVRDRLGVKPLYFALVGDSLLFASEAKAILASGLVPRLPDREALTYFLATGYLPHAATPFAGVQKLPAGHLLKFDENGLTMERYWQPTTMTDLPWTRMDVHDELFSEVFDAVKLHVEGVDSAAVVVDRDIGSAVLVGVCSLVLKKKIRTYAIGFGVEGFDHLDHSRVVSRHFNTEHVEFLGERGPAVMGHLIAKMQWHLDAPCTDPAHLELLEFAHMAGSCGPAALASCGLEEVMLISPEHLAALKWTSLPLPRRADGGVAHSVMCAERGVVDGVFGKETLAPTDQPPGTTAIAPNDLPIQSLEATLAAWSAAGAASGMEFIFPLADHLLAEFIFALPWELKTDGGKCLLTESFKNLVPPQLTYRYRVAEKFSLPKSFAARPDDDSWLKPEGLWDEVKKRVMDRRNSLRDYISKSEVEKLLREHEERAANHASRVWRLLALAEWLAQQVDVASPPTYVPWPPCAKGYHDRSRS